MAQPAMQAWLGLDLPPRASSSSRRVSALIDSIGSKLPAEKFRTGMAPYWLASEPTAAVP